LFYDLFLVLKTMDLWRQAMRGWHPDGLSNGELVGLLKLLCLIERLYF
jgi:hypothetical protein